MISIAIAIIQPRAIKETTPINHFNEVMEANADAFGIPVAEMVEVKAKFCHFNHKIFTMMTMAQEILEPYFGGD